MPHTNDCQVTTMASHNCGSFEYFSLRSSQKQNQELDDEHSGKTGRLAPLHVPIERFNAESLEQLEFTSLDDLSEQPALVLRQMQVLSRVAGFGCIPTVNVFAVCFVLGFWAKSGAAVSRFRVFRLIHSGAPDAASHVSSDRHLRVRSQQSHPTKVDG